MKRIHETKIDDAKFYEKVWAEEYNARPYFDAVRMRALIRDVKDGDKVIDVGAGVFGAVQYIAEKTGLKCSLTAYDQSYTAKEIVENIAPQINYIVGECEGKLPFEDNSFDVVIAGELIEHMEDPATFCSELARICKVGGSVALSTVDTNCPNAIKHGDYAEHIWEFTPEDLLAFFTPFGDARYEVVGDYHFIYFLKQWL
jgi:ubiquinone/menaquinone biosynthesis C-methylase UbiE